MAFTFTVDGVRNMGAMRMIHGTFTSASGDTSATLDASTHGCNFIADYGFSFDTDVIGAQEPRISKSAGTLTITMDDSLGNGGRWKVIGR